MSLEFKAAAFGFAPGHALVNGTEFIANSSPAPDTSGPTFLMDTAGHNLSYDADGTGGGAAVLIAHMNAQQCGRIRSPLRVGVSR